MLTNKIFQLRKYSLKSQAHSEKNPHGNIRFLEGTRSDYF